MSEKRKDKKGRILRTGESQRPNLTYQFRYKDIRGKTHYVYAPSLEELREKEIAIQKDITDGIDYCAGETTVLELIERDDERRRRGFPDGQRRGLRLPYEDREAPQPPGDGPVPV